MDETRNQRMSKLYPIRITEFGEIDSFCSKECCRYYYYLDSRLPRCNHEKYPYLSEENKRSWCPLEKASIVEIILYDNEEK